MNNQTMILGAIVSIVLYAHQSVAQTIAPLNELTKAVLHDSSMHTASIERASLMLYFMQEPVIKVDKAMRKQEVVVTIFFPKTTVQQAELKSLSTINTATHNFYHLSLQAVKNPETGILITVSYDPEKTALSYNVFDTIGLQKGFVLTLYNKIVMTKLQLMEKPPILTAWNPMHPARIVIDCGHGGSDTGTVGLNGMKEKDLTLAIGTKVASALTQLGMQVALTRTNDTELSFAERTGLAHTLSADALVSIHANHAPDKERHGIETFYCGLSPGVHTPFSTLDKDEQHILATWYRAYEQATKNLAHLVHHQLITNLSVARSDMRDRGIKRAVSQLLLGSKVPTILVEVGFLSNEHEAALLAQEPYQLLIAQGIAKGISLYSERKNS